jgi:signal transduction histidine kinase
VSVQREQTTAATPASSARHPITRHREEIAAAWLELLPSISIRFEEVGQWRHVSAIDRALTIVMHATAAGEPNILDEFFVDVESALVELGFTVGDLTRGVLAGARALDAALPPDERFSPDVRAFERNLAELAARMAERGQAIVTRQLEEEAAAQRMNRAKLVALQRVGAVVTSSLEIDSTLEAIVHEAAELMDAPSRLRLADESGQSLRLIASAGEPGEDAPGSVVPIESTLAGLCYRSGRPVISNDIAADPRHDPDVLRSSQARSLLSVPLLARALPIGVLTITSRSGRVFDDEDAEILSLFADHAATAIENSRLYQQAQSQITELEILNRVSAVVSASLELETVYGAIHQEIARIMVADAFLIIIATPAGDYDLVYVVDEGVRYAERHNIALPKAYVEALERRAPTIIEASEHADFHSWERYGDMTRRIRSLVVAPLVRGGESIGLITAQSYLPKSFRQRDIDLFTTIANVAAIAIENARLYDQAQELAISEERNRLAREIHDTIAQGLVGIILQLEVMSASIPEDSPLHRRVARALDLARVNLDEARRSVRNLRASPLAKHSFTEAIQRLAEEHRLDCGSQVLVNVPAAVPHLDEEIETALFRLTQEALNNCRKHANADTVWIDLTFGDEIVLRIADNGVGFDVEAWRTAPATHRFGLHGMRERVEQLAGSFDLQARSGGGIVLTATVPFASAPIPAPLGLP